MEEEALELRCMYVCFNVVVLVFLPKGRHGGGGPRVEAPEAAVAGGDGALQAEASRCRLAQAGNVFGCCGGSFINIFIIICILMIFTGIILIISITILVSIS